MKTIGFCTVLIATSVVHAQDVFMPMAKQFLKTANSEMNPFEMYTASSLYTPDEMEERPVGDVQFRCQYMAGLNFYDLQPLDIY